MIRPRDENSGEEMSARADRLKQARQFARFGTAAEAAKRFGWVAPTYRAHENGGRIFSAKAAHLYSQAFGVRFEWLFYGRGRMLEDETARPPQPELAPAVSEPPNASSPIANITFPMRRLPVYGYAKGGPEGALILDGTVVAQVECLPGLELVEKAYAVYVTGDSMEPRYFANETVYVHPFKSPRRGDFVVVQIHRAGEPPTGYIKQFVGWSNGDLILSQFNPPQEIKFPESVVQAVHLIVGSRSA